MGERNLSPCLMLNLWWKGTWSVTFHQAHSISSTNIYALRWGASPRTNRSLREAVHSTGPNGDIAVLLAQMVVICMQMRNKLNLVSPLTSCPIKEGSHSSKRAAATPLICHHRLITTSTLITICF